MTANTAQVLDIFEGETSAKFGDSLQVEAVRELIADIREKGQMTPAKSVLCATALRLAAIVELPKSAVASVQAAAQLTVLVEKLTADVGDSAGMTEETKALIRALTIDPALYAGTPASDPAEPVTPQPAAT